VLAYAPCFGQRLSVQRIGDVSCSFPNADHAGWIAAYDDPRRHIAGNDRPCAHYGVVSYANAGADEGLRRNPDTAPDYYLWSQERHRGVPVVVCSGTKVNSLRYNCMLADADTTEVINNAAVSE